MTLSKVGMKVKWKKLSGVVMTGIIINEDKRFYFVKSDKFASEREYDFTITKAQVNDMPELFEFEAVNHDG